MAVRRCGTHKPARKCASSPSSHRLPAHFVTRAAFSPDSQYVLIWSYYGEARLWDIDYHDFIDYACSRIFSDFSPDEHNEYQIDDLPTCPTQANISPSPISPTWTPIPAGTIPVWTPLPTLTQIPIKIAQIGDNHGEIIIGELEYWTYAGDEGEVITIRVNAEVPALSDQIRNINGIDTYVGLRTADDTLIAENDDSSSDLHYTDSLIETFTLPANGTYLIEVRDLTYEKGGIYTLVIESSKERNNTGTELPPIISEPTISPTPIPGQ